VTELRTLGKQTLVYGLSSAAPQIVGLLTLPIIARVLTTSDYGVLEIAIVSVGLIGIGADLGLSSASQRSFFDYTSAQELERRAVLTTALVTVMTLACVLAALAFALREPIAEVLFGTSAEAAVVTWMAVLLVATQLSVFAREVLRLHFWASAYLVSSIVAAVVGGVISVVGVALLDGGPEAMLAGAVLGAAGGGAYGMIRARGRYIGRFSRPELRRMLSYGIPLVPTALSVWALTFVDRLLLEHLGSLSDVGEYAMANRLASILLLVVIAFGIAFSPFALDLRTREPGRERAVRARALTALVTVLALIGTALSVFAREALAVLAPSFGDAANTVGLLCLGTLLYGIASVVMLEISIARRTRVFAVYSTIGALVNVALNLVLIPPLGTVGAGIATVAAFLVLSVGYWWHAQRIASTPYETLLVIELIVAAAVVGALGLLPLGFVYALVKVAGMAAFVAWLAVRGLLSLGPFRSPQSVGGA
jgi:O-antigen/teichoic acid export membrane protein